MIMRSEGPVIHVEALEKVFPVPVREAGLRASLRSLVHREVREVRAVDGVSFDIERGEVVGFLGPNGAGKTTTLKMLSGLLRPSGGSASVLGYEPGRRDPAMLSRLALVMGNRNQLQWDLPALDSFELNRSIYRIPRVEFVEMRDELIDLLDISGLVNKPVRNLSLGERMKVEIAGSLLHRPAVLFLDEPTIGLDITMQKRIRAFIGTYNARSQATVVLTSHYMADVQALCKRVIVIHEGRVLFDGDLSALSQRFAATKTIVVRFDPIVDSSDVARPMPDMSRYGTVLSGEGDAVSLAVPRKDVATVTARILGEQAVLDLTIEDPPIDDVIEQVFTDGSIVEGASGD
ncbi:MAG: ATP-binding cassette domain-containing protein [Ilumatobacteraceae bacterium]